MCASVLQRTCLYAVPVAGGTASPWHRLVPGSCSGNYDCLYGDCITLHAGNLHELTQNIPSIDSIGDSDSDDEDEDIIFSGLHNSHQEVRVYNIPKDL